MSHILLFEKAPDLQALYGLNLSVYLERKIYTATSMDEFSDWMGEYPDIATFIVNNDTGKKDIAQLLYEFLKPRGNPFHLFVIGKTLQKSSEVTTLPSTIHLKDLLKRISGHFGITPQSMAALNVPDPYPLPMEFIRPGQGAMCDVFIQHQNKYIVSIKKGNLITPTHLQDRQQLFVAKNDRLKFVNNVTSMLIDKMMEPGISDPELIDHSSKALDMVAHHAQSMGIGPSTLEVAKSVITAIKTLTQKQNKLSELLRLLLDSPASYRYTHSVLVSFIGSHIVEKMEWGTPEQQEKIGFVALFHDIALPKDEYAKIQSDQELEMSPLSKEEKNAIHQHALTAAALVAGAERFPLGAETIIKQHHGSRTGKGFNQLALTLSPLAIVFICAHTWADLVLANKNTPHSEVMKELGKRFNNPSFKKILTAVEKVTIS